MYEKSFTAYFLSFITVYHQICGLHSAIVDLKFGLCMKKSCQKNVLMCYVPVTVALQFLTFCCLSRFNISMVNSFLFLYVLCFRNPQFWLLNIAYNGANGAFNAWIPMVSQNFRELGIGEVSACNSTSMQCHLSQRST